MGFTTLGSEPCRSTVSVLTSWSLAALPLPRLLSVSASGRELCDGPEKPGCCSRAVCRLPAASLQDHPTDTKALWPPSSLCFLPPLLSMWVPAVPNRLPLSPPRSRQGTLLQVGVLGWGFDDQPRNPGPQEVGLIASIYFPGKQAVLAFVSQDGGGAGAGNTLRCRSALLRA